MRTSHLLVVVFFVLASAAGCQTKNGINESAISFEDIAIAYHGMLLDERLQEIKLDRSSIEKMQDSMVHSLLEEGDEGARKRNGAFVYEALNSFSLENDERVIIKNGVIGRLIDQLPYEKAHLKYNWPYKLLRERSYEFIRIPQFEELRPEIRELITTIGIWVHVRPLRALEGYIRDCGANKVPIAPDWGSPGWQFRGDLDPPYNFIGSGLTKVYTYNDANGVCFALPRSNSGLMGIICQSEVTGRACFWDNIDAATGARINWETSPVVIANLKNGSDLVENCTVCHRGKNVFLIHPGSALQVPSLDTDPGVRYTPLGQVGWRNLGPLSNPNLARCTSCHELPEVGSTYCEQILRTAADRTMPSVSSPAGWDSPSATYSSDINSLKNSCATASSSSCGGCH